MAAANSDHLYTRSIKGVTWVARAGVGAWTAVASSSNGTSLVAAMNGNYLYTSPDAEVTWVMQLGSRRQGGFVYCTQTVSSALGKHLAA